MQNDKKGIYTGEKAGNWKGGKAKHNLGYIWIWKPSHPNSDHRGYVLEHRLKMEEYLRRYLTKDEVVHHINGDKSNNFIGNLMLFASNGEHLRYELTGVPKCKYGQT